MAEGGRFGKGKVRKGGTPLQGRACAPLPGLQGWSGQPTPGSTRGHRMAWDRLDYLCPDCGARWDDEWSCGCDDTCPDCGSGDISPLTATDLSLRLHLSAAGRPVVSISRHDADDDPAYVDLSVEKVRQLAAAIATPTAPRKD